MKLNVFLVFAAVASAISAINLDTNAQRMARGLSPLPPVRRATPVDGMFLSSFWSKKPSMFVIKVAKKHRPSGSHHGCNTGSLHCCMCIFSSTLDLGPHCSEGDSVQTYDSDKVADLSKFGIPIPVGIPIGIACSPIGILGTHTWYSFRSLALRSIN
jgi:hypothetical protein